MKKKSTLLLALALAPMIMPAMAEPIYYEFQGPVTQIRDFTESQFLAAQYAKGQARYVVRVDTFYSGWWLSGATGKKITPRSTRGLGSNGTKNQRKSLPSPFSPFFPCICINIAIT